MEPKKKKDGERERVFDPEGTAALAKRFRELRKKAGLTQEQLSFESGVDRRQIQRIEKGETEIGNSSIFYVARALEIDPDEFYKFKLTPEHDPRNKSDE